MIVYSLSHLVVFRQALWLWRKETILTNKPIFLTFFLKYWPLKGLYFPDVCTKAGFQRTEQVICDWVLPLTWRGVICNPNECLLFLSLYRACVGSCKASCEYEQPLTSVVSFWGFQDTHFVHAPALHFQSPVESLSLCIRTVNAQALGWFWGLVFVRCKKAILFLTSQLALVS